jgi:hypothetical protein
MNAHFLSDGGLAPTVDLAARSSSAELASAASCGGSTQSPAVCLGSCSRVGIGRTRSPTRWSTAFALAGERHLCH